MKEKKRIESLKELKRKSREYSIKEGVFSTIKDSVANNYISPFAILLGASNSLIAMLSSIPGLLGPLSQLLSSRLIEKYPRKNIVLKSVFFEILAWIPLIIIALFYYKGIIINTLPLMLLIFFCLYIITANTGVPAWFSWVGDIVDEDYRGRWFGKRIFIFGVITLISTIFAALFLDFLKKNNLTIFGFIILFVIAIISRTISRNYLKKQYEPKMELEKSYYFSFYSFVKKAPHNNFGRFAIYRALLNGVTLIAGPFFAIYMLRDLNFSYLTFIIVTISTTFFSLLTIRLWGKFSDKYGNYEIFKITLVLIVITPILWVFSKSPIYLIFVAQFASGIGWSGFNLAASNYILDCVTPQKRGLAFSYAEMLNGIGIFIGAGIGALLIKILAINFMNPILIIFIISGITRLIIGLIMLPKIREVKSKEKFNGHIFVKSFLFKTIRMQ